MPLSVVQHTGASAAAAGSVTTAVGISTSTGNLVHVDIGVFYQQGVYASMSDTAGNTFLQAVASFQDPADPNGANAILQTRYAKNAIGNGSNIYQVVLTGSGYATIGVIEIQGANTTSPLDLAEHGIGTTTSPTFTTSGTTAQANEVVIGTICQSAGASNTTVPGGWQKQYDEPNNGFCNLCDATKIVSATGTQTFNPTESGISFNHYLIAITTYKEAGGAGFTAVNRRSLGPRVGSRSTY